MINNNSLVILDELNKGCGMGMEALGCILEKVQGKELKENIFELHKKYNELSNKIEELHDKNSTEKIDENSTMSKAMTWYGIQIRTITDSSDSKLTEMTMQGLNMGIIDGIKLLKQENLDKKVKKLVEDYIDMQEKYVEKLKKYL